MRRDRARSLHVAWRACAVTFAALICAAGTAVADDGDQDAGTSVSQPLPRSPDFFFNRPKATIGLRGSWVLARAGSDLFDFLSEQLTIEKSDFHAPAVVLEGGASVTPRLDVLAGFEYSRASIRSEYRDFVDQNELPITQSTALKTINLSGSVRYALLERVRQVGRLAWVPRRVVPYVGTGGGAHWYQFSQQGDFVDFVDLSIFTGFFQSEGWAPSAHAFGGVDIQTYTRMFVTIEGRYLWSSAELSDDFIDFEPIDLSGFRISGGVNFVF